MGSVGAGTYGTVMKCFNVTNGQVVAVKRLRDSMAGRQGARQRRCCEMMVREICLLQALNNDHVVSMIETFRHKGYVHMVFPLMRYNLYKYLELNGGALTINATKACIYQVSIFPRYY